MLKVLGLKVLGKGYKEVRLGATSQEPSTGCLASLRSFGVIRAIIPFVTWAGHVMFLGIIITITITIGFAGRGHELISTIISIITILQR